MGSECTSLGSAIILRAEVRSQFLFESLAKIDYRDTALANR